MADRKLTPLKFLEMNSSCQFLSDETILACANQSGNSFHLLTILTVKDVCFCVLCLDFFSLNMCPCVLVFVSNPRKLSWILSMPLFSCTLILHSSSSCTPQSCLHGVCYCVPLVKDVKILWFNPESSKTKFDLRSRDLAVKLGQHW